MVFAKVVAGVLGTAALGTMAVFSEGVIRIRVYEKHRGGTHLSIIAPALVVPVALRFVPKENLEEPSREVRHWLPMIRAATQELRQCPDSVLIEVAEGNQYVKVSTSGGSLLVDVDDPEETVHVAMPLRAAQDAAEQLASVSGKVI